MDKLNLKVIAEAYNHGEDITDYLAHKYDKNQIQEIETALRQGVDINLLVKDDYTAQQMTQIRVGVNWGLKPNEIAIYAKKSIPANVMHKLMRGLKLGINVKPIADLPINHIQMEEAIKWLDKGINVNLIKEYVKPTSTKQELEQLGYALLWNFTKEQIKQFEKYILPTFNNLQLSFIRLAVNDGFTEKQLDFIANPEYSWELIRELKSAISQGLSIDLLQQAIDKGLTHKHISYMVDLAEKGIKYIIE